MTVTDLIVAGLLRPGSILYAGSKRYPDAIAIVLPDGRLEVGGVAYDSPSGAGRAVRDKRTNGWWFWRTDPDAKSRLSELRRLYAASIGEDVGDDDEDEFGDENGDDE